MSTDKKDCYLKDQLVSHGEGSVQFPRQAVDLFLEILSVRQNLQGGGATTTQC